MKIQTKAKNTDVEEFIHAKIFQDRKSIIEVQTKINF